MASGDSLDRAHNEDDAEKKKKEIGVVRRRFTVPLLNRFRLFSFSVPTRGRLFDCVTTALTVFADGFIYLLGPVLVVVALAIISFLSHTFFTVLWPMLMTPYGNVWSIPGVLHASFVIFVVGNILHNYYKCVTTSNKGPRYDAVVRELAEATNFVYPETPDELQNARSEYEFKIMQRSRARRGLPPQTPQRKPPPAAAPSHSNDALASQSPITIMSGDANSTDVANGSTSTKPTRRASSDTQGGESVPPRQQQRRQQQPPKPFVPRWMLMGPQEWAFCPYSKQPKPPRAHYDHVTKILVLNMDHYCPWMFNTVGYFNYRYFVNFLLYVAVGMLYGAIMSYRPFRNMETKLFRDQMKTSRSKGLKVVDHLFSKVPLPSERTQISFTFMLCISVGIAVLCLLSFHIYLILTAQTTIEFHGNISKRRMARKRGIQWINPYDLGWKKNWQQVYGSKPFFRSILASGREPEFLPVPIAGELGRRSHAKKELKSSSNRLPPV
eukprot:CAMPEP_0198281512 /NCGR_PEP_ID=MMETSP1449-20131203/1429_1 /TAXON_ID=420275 /ORGANISM="Attheya septentrionalis, Strain CCMP2084" /LENGTH=495 /DNA_ID=CAMNT_0043977309 /DNA_START=226 /DNA_END=1713 /DNA_ORIENTATION=+